MMQWLGWIMEAYNHKITADEAGSTLIRDTIHKLAAEGKKNAREVFLCFRETWTAVWPHLGNLLGCAAAANTITDFTLTEDISVKCCLPGNNQHNTNNTITSLQENATTMRPSHAL